MITRRDVLKISGASIAAGCLGPLTGFTQPARKKAKFTFCLNTSTIRGQKPGLEKSIEIASRAGYDGVELWIRDIQAWLDDGNSTAKLKKYISDSKLKVENAIGFAPWLADDSEKRKVGFKQMREEMELLAKIGGTRIAAAPAGLKGNQPLDLLICGEYYQELLELGRETGVMPQLEFWGPSNHLYHLGQVLMIAAAANHPDARILPDVYHLFRGGSGFEGLKMLSGRFIEIFHMNDYPGNIPRIQQNDSHRVYPGDGVAPLKQILTDLSNAGGTKALSLELFNPGYWKQDPYTVAKTGLEKMKKAVKSI